ncbi:MAG: hypothetical protein U9P12_02620 [Verrucomicrobiota bacterium]|nr:hypothetical protein [Verrucomicrobiota bacterium]
MKMMKWFGLLVALFLAGCTSDSGYSGVDNVWRSANPPVWEVGVTTETDVIDALGPPSQLIGLEKENVYYYLREERKATGVFLLAYNWKNQKLVYDRAIFFFDKQGKLTKHSYSHEALPYEEAD